MRERFETAAKEAASPRETEEATLGRRAFLTRFKVSLIRRAGQECFSDGCRIADYADENGPAYWDNPRLRAQGPEECAQSDMRYWHSI